eukprot:9264484-Alexandrium_andersonii.AAC.1
MALFAKHGQLPARRLGHEGAERINRTRVNEQARATANRTCNTRSTVNLRSSLSPPVWPHHLRTRLGHCCKA